MPMLVPMQVLVFVPMFVPMFVLVLVLVLVLESGGKLIDSFFEVLGSPTPCGISYWRVVDYILQRLSSTSTAALSTSTAALSTKKSTSGQPMNEKRLTLLRISLLWIIEGYGLLNTEWSIRPFP
jgi:uncharacterized membrane protein YadS